MIHNSPHFKDEETEAWRTLRDLPRVNKLVNAEVGNQISKPMLLELPWAGCIWEVSLYTECTGVVQCGGPALDHGKARTISKLSGKNCQTCQSHFICHQNVRQPICL